MSLKNDINFSLWCDFIERDFLENRFKELIEDEIIQGATSNPSIFEQSILNSNAYRQQLDMLQANDQKKIYEELATTDIKRASELLYELNRANSDDGFISLEVDPLLCDDEKGTIEEGVRLYNSIGHENVMIKIPATPSGYNAMRELTKMGISVNATLIFSPLQAIECAKALDEGIKQSDRSDVRAVISVFVSRFDKMCDDEFENKNLPVSKLGIVNATKCYHEVNKFGNQKIRTLFASTATKSPNLDMAYYVDNLIYPNSVNTVPLGTIEYYIENSKKTKSEILSEDECDGFFDAVASVGINMQRIYDDLLKEGLEQFKESFSEMLQKLKAKKMV